MDSQFFDQEAAEKHLLERERIARESREKLRLDTLSMCQAYLKERFSSKKIEVYLVGSLTRPYDFHRHSDIDIVLKGFSGDRFEIWTELERAFNRQVEVILFEFCPFQEYVVEQGIKVV